jgi:hypothetical protein
MLVNAQASLVLTGSSHFIEKPKRAQVLGAHLDSATKRHFIDSRNLEK